MTTDTNIAHSLRRTLHGFPVDIMPAAAEAGGIEILVWKDVHLHEGMIRSPEIPWRCGALPARR